MSSLQGKVALVTGSSRGIGAAIAIALAKEGADVVINHVSPSSKKQAEEVSKEAKKHGVKSLIVQANLGSLEEIDILVQKTVAEFGHIDILVNNGGVLDNNEFIGQITRETYNKVYDVNVRAPIFLTQAVVPHMGDGGRIINVSSIVSRIAHPGSTIYSSSKAALESVTRVMGAELREKGIRVNSVIPGPVETDMFSELPSETQETSSQGLTGR